MFIVDETISQAMVSGIPLPETVDIGNKWAKIADNSRAG